MTTLSRVNKCLNNKNIPAIAVLCRLQEDAILVKLRNTGTKAKACTSLISLKLSQISFAFLLVLEIMIKMAWMSTKAAHGPIFLMV